MRLSGCLQRPVAASSSGGLARLMFDERGVRSWARALLFVVTLGICVAIAFLTTHLAVSLDPGLRQRLHEAVLQAKTGGNLPAWVLIFNELIMLACALAATWIMTRLDGSPLASIGFPRRRWVGGLVAGSAVGFCMIGLLVAGLLAFGFGRLEPPTAGLAVALRSGLAWAVAALLVGLFEEITFRGYLFAILRERHGIWIGTLVVTLLFMLAHAHNLGENPIGLFTAGAASVLFCLAIFRTGALWWAIGCHAAWDWAESYFYGSADSGMHSAGSLFTLLPQGNVYLSGGTAGPEGSLLCVVVLIIVILALPLLIRRRPDVPGPQAAVAESGEP